MFRKYPLTFFVPSVFAVIALIIIFFIQLNKPPTIDGFRKIELIGNFYDPWYPMPDTVIHYELTNERLTLRFDPKAKHKDWIIDAYLIRNGKHNHKLSPDRKYRIQNNKIEFNDLYLTDEEVDSSYLLIDACPNLDDSKPLLINAFYISILIKFCQDQDGPIGTLSPAKRPGVHYVTFDFNYLETLPEHEQEFLMEFLRHKYRTFSLDYYDDHPAVIKEREESMKNLMEKLNAKVYKVGADSTE